MSLGTYTIGAIIAISVVVAGAAEVGKTLNNNLGKTVSKFTDNKSINLYDKYNRFIVQAVQKGVKPVAIVVFDGNIYSIDVINTIKNMDVNNMTEEEVINTLKQSKEVKEVFKGVPEEELKDIDLVLKIVVNDIHKDKLNYKDIPNTVEGITELEKDL